MVRCRLWRPGLHERLQFVMGTPNEVGEEHCRGLYRSIPFGKRLDLERTPSEVARQAGLHVDEGTGEPVIDETARDAYRRRITELEQDLDTAEQMGDADAAAHHRSERDALVDHLVAAYGLGGRPRRTADHVERARKAVSRRVHTMVTRVDDAHPQLGRHLRASLRTGVFCSYQPDRSLHWTIKLP